MKIPFNSPTALGEEGVARVVAERAARRGSRERRDGMCIV